MEVRGETSDGFAKCRLFSQANELHNMSPEKEKWPKFSWDRSSHLLTYYV